MENHNKKVLLIEPSYANKYPPLGLMKIATAHKLCGDNIYFYRGMNAALRDENWDIIYISTLFTFQWKGVIETINFYAKGKNKIIIGDYTVVAPNCYIVDHEHGFSKKDVILNQKSILKEVIIKPCHQIGLFYRLFRRLSIKQ